MSAATAIEAVRHGQHAHGGDTTSAATALERDTSTISTLTGAKLWAGLARSNGTLAVPV
jgi:hypothetical protein